MRKKRKSAFIFLIFLIMCFEVNLSLSWANVEYTASGLRDPFENQLPQPQPIAEEPGVVSETHREPLKPPEFSVEGIVSGGPVPQAVIQKKIVRIGDRIEQAIITNITKEGVEVNYQGETFVVPAPSRAKPPAKGGQNVRIE